MTDTYYIPEDQATNPDTGQPHQQGDTWFEQDPKGNIYQVLVTNNDNGTLELTAYDPVAQKPASQTQQPRQQAAQPNYVGYQSPYQNSGRGGATTLPTQNVDPSIAFQLAAIQQALAAAGIELNQHQAGTGAAGAAMAYPAQIAAGTGFYPNPNKFDFGGVGQFLLGQQSKPFPNGVTGGSSGFVRYSPTYQLPSGSSTGGQSGSSAGSMDYASALASARSQLASLDPSWQSRPDQDVISEWLNNPTIGVGQDAIKNALRGH